MQGALFDQTIYTSRDEATQLVSLKIIKAVAAKLKAEELSLLMSHVTAFGVHPSASCRLIMFDILMWIYDNYKLVFILYLYCLSVYIIIPPAKQSFSVVKCF